MDSIQILLLFVFNFIECPIWHNLEKKYSPEPKNLKIKKFFVSPEKCHILAYKVLHCDHRCVTFDLDLTSKVVSPNESTYDFLPDLYK